jgi:23S rRNA G2069 N7-methylase RlmK/C1962 C5-methylase RlmI
MTPPGQRPENRSGENTAAQAEMFRNRLGKRYRHLKKWAKLTGAGAYRLYDRDIPEIPLVLDLYGDAVSGALYKRPYEKDAAEENRWLRVMTAAASEALNIPESRIFLKERRRQRGTAQYEKQGDRQFTRDIYEGGLVFRVNLSEYLDTGLFLDRRKMRSLVRADSAGKTVLNLFCYTASFSVYAADGGAAAVDSVDMSNTYLTWGLENFKLNGLRGEAVSGEAFFGTPRSHPAGRVPEAPGKPRRSPYRFIRADVLSFLEGAEKAGRRWDRIILDPPAFSNSKKMHATLDTRRDHRPLISRCAALLSPGGKLWFSTTIRNLKLSPEDFPGITVRDMGTLLGDEDFRGKKIPPCYLFEV